MKKRKTSAPQTSPEIVPPMTEQDRIALASSMIHQALEQCGVAFNPALSARAFKGATFEDLGGAFLIRQGEGSVLVESAGFQLVALEGWQSPQAATVPPAETDNP